MGLNAYLNPDTSLPKRDLANPCILVIFGIAGDLTKRLLFPAICNLGSLGLLNHNFRIIGISREKHTNASFRNQLEKDIDAFIKDESAKKFGMQFLPRVEYIAGDFSAPKTYQDLNVKIVELNKIYNASKNCLFYFASPPGVMETIAEGLRSVSLLSENEDQFRRIVVEKPFGRDLMSAKKLNSFLLSIANETQIFRIDHFLGKETVQNIVAFRFLNNLFEPIWNRLYIDHVQITVAETLGVEMRGQYYETTGALRDMVPNHLFQILSLIAMEPPSSFSSEDIKAEKEKALRAVRKMTPEQVLSRAIRGQYDAYRSEPSVAADSNVETFVALKLFIENWRWLNVPFYLRTGKRLAERRSEVLVQFRPGPSIVFGSPERHVTPNLLHIFIQPDEGMAFHFNTKVPGPRMELEQVHMKFEYSDYFGIRPRNGYEMILYDCMIGDQLLFNTAQVVETSWSLVQPILDVWQAISPRDFPNYASGSCGPKEADDLMFRDKRRWLL